MSDLFYPGLTTAGRGRYLNLADFPENNRLRNLGGVVQQQTFAADGSNDLVTDLLPLSQTPLQSPINDDGLVLRMGTNFGNANLGVNSGKPIIVDDHIGNAVRCGMTRSPSTCGSFCGFQQQWNWTRDGTNQDSTFLWGSGSQASNGFCAAYWVRLRNNATSQDSPGNPVAWGTTVTENNGSSVNNFVIFGTRGGGNILTYRHATGSASAGKIVFRPDFNSSNDIVLTEQPPATSEWMHVAFIRNPGTNSDAQSQSYRIYINGVGQDVTANANNFSVPDANIRVGYTSGGINQTNTMPLTADTSELWIGGVTAYGSTLWDDDQVKKMYEIGIGTFIIPNFTNQTKANNASYGTFTWEAPMGVTEINFTGAASGGGGGTSPTANNVSTNNAAGGGGGGGGSAFLFEEDITVVAGQSYTFIVADGGASATDGSDLTIEGQINGSSIVTVTINGGKKGNAGSIGTNAASGGTAGAGGASTTTGGEITTSGAAGGGGGASQNSLPVSSPGTAGGNTTVNGVTVSGGSGGAGGASRRRGGGGGGGASILGGGNGGGGSNAAAAGAGGGGGGGAGFLIGNGGGTGSAGSGGAGGFTFTYSLPKDSTDNPLVGP